MIHTSNLQQYRNSSREVTIALIAAGLMAVMACDDPYNALKAKYRALSDNYRILSDKYLTLDANYLALKASCAANTNASTVRGA